LQRKIQGVIAVVLTPFDKEENIDYSALERLIEFMLSKGIHGLFPCGSISLGPLMKPEERKQVLEFIVKVNRERVPIIAQIGAADTRTAVDLASSCPIVWGGCSS
jgi:dihydrodipicolinate synthase/N-acetylneuraminate lyase